MSVLVDKDIRALCNPPYGVFNGRHLLYIRSDSPLLDPFSEGVQDGGVISYGLTQAGYDLRLGDTVLVFKGSYAEVMSPKRMKNDNDPSYLNHFFDSRSALVPHQGVVIPPHSYILGYTLEYIRMPRVLKGRCVGKSTYARCGLVVNTTPLEPEWEGHLTLEIANVSPCPVEVYVHEGIAQLELETLTGEPMTSYKDKGGKYQGQGPKPVPAKVKE